ncbi:hypothetical protein HDV00_004728 [Rhizophlyctis rosea]|nr:hypothetical protein HDV00_004728 [Rhizophlyctis rosea]
MAGLVVRRLIRIPFLRQKIEPFRVSLINYPEYHFEVLLPILHTFSNQPNVIVEVFATNGAKRFGGRDLIQQVPTPHPINIRSVNDLTTLEYVPDLAILVTCPRDLEWLPEAFVNVTNPYAPREILCVVHQANEWAAGNSKWRNRAHPWIQTSRFNFVTLSEHVREYVASKVTAWKMSPAPHDPFAPTYETPSVRVLPAFPPVIQTTLSDNLRPCIAMQGNFESHRRNYSKVFDSMSKRIYDFQKHNASLLLLGQGQAARLPPDLQPFAVSYRDLSFPEYWSKLSECIALIPGFAHSGYLQNRASSTIATSITVGTPVIASREIVEKYTYLGGVSDSEAFWLQAAGETDMETFARILEMGPERWRVMKEAVQRRRAYLMSENLKMVGMVVDAVRNRTETGGETITR